MCPGVRTDHARHPGGHAQEDQRGQNGLKTKFGVKKVASSDCIVLIWGLKCKGEKLGFQFCVPWYILLGFLLNVKSKMAASLSQSAGYFLASHLPL